MRGKCQMPSMSYMTNNDIFDMYGAITYTMYVCQYGCQKNRQDLRKASIELELPRNLVLGRTNRNLLQLAFSLVFKKNPLYISNAIF